MTSRSKLRTTLREKRRALTAEQQHSAGVALYDVIKAWAGLDGAQHIALYLANDGEISPEYLMHQLWEAGKRCYLPVVNGSDGTLIFAEHKSSDSPLVFNRYGIPEPDLSCVDTIPVDKIDLVFVPLTGFDEAGRRLGMGGGYYDKTFAFTAEKNGVNTRQKPILVGLAHECQKVEAIPVESWDVPMETIITDSQVYSA